ncbi:hypothetical protein FA13DRAFT_1741614 [Coprinellus micaceus]|uniref:Uncharacterized protein n=1 Tax=Coprinellus micaceus TaxID=71717 RepID=A0A4Y7SJB2_COPMI|nr:hypothetical protein FA13DRAFT_1741614 [Coprinellus micaceus]
MEERPQMSQADAEKASVQSARSRTDVNPKMEKRLLRNLDWILLPSSPPFVSHSLFDNPRIG